MSDGKTEAMRGINFGYKIPTGDIKHMPNQKWHKIISFCDLEWDKNCLEFYKSKRRVRTASVSQVRKPLYNSSKDKWKVY